MQVKDIIRRGGIGVLLTDTIYGLVGSAFSKKAVAKIYKVKGRHFRKPLIVLISSYKDLEKFGIRLSADQKKLLQKYWKIGSRPTSVILPVPSKRFTHIHRGTDSIAFRLPASGKTAWLRKLIRDAGPIVAPSANPEGEPPATTISEAINYFGGQLDFYLDGGRREGKPSRLVQLTRARAKVLR